jgi:hypothetical protein
MRSKPSGPERPAKIGAAALLVLAQCSSGPIALHAPDIAPGTAREPTPVELEPIVPGAKDAIVGDFAAPGPAAVLTAAMKAELGGRALRGGEPQGYAVRCMLGRLAVRARTAMTDSQEMVVLYVDLSCEAKRASDGATVWRGALRGRSCSAAPNILASDTSTTQRLVDRAFSDAAREMASDLAVRALALLSEPSARVFPDAIQERVGAGLDDSPYGPAALMENPAAVEGALRSLGEHDATMRASAWNVAAMAAGPGEPWPGGEKISLDEDPVVRFAQYKALARLETALARRQLEIARDTETDPLLAEFLGDSLASRGLGVTRSRRP